jgi:hypothetical protein
MRATPMSRIVPGLLLLGLLAVACSDRSSPVDPDGIATPEAASFAHGPACDLTQGIRSDVRDYFPNGSTERRVASDKAQDLQKACNAGNEDEVVRLATDLLDMIETLLNDGKGGSATVGSRLANRLLACWDSLCSSAHVPDPELELVGPMSPYGLFAVRGKDRVPAVARGAFPFTDVEGEENRALWGVEVKGDWSKIMGATQVLVYGHRAGGADQDVKDTPFGGVAFEIKRFPDEGPFNGVELVQVGLCLARGITPSSDVLQERVQRNSTILTPHDPGFCNALQSSLLSRAGSTIASIASYARSFFAEPLLAAIRRTTVSGVGGSPFTFSEFTAVFADPNGSLELVKPPPSVVVVGDPFSIEIQALSGGGTPIERVVVTLAVDGNSGAPGGATLTLHPNGETGTSVQLETDEEDGKATFNVSVNKPGGYVLCATGDLAGFTFEPVCTDLFHARSP